MSSSCAEQVGGFRLTLNPWAEWRVDRATRPMEISVRIPAAVFTLQREKRLTVEWRTKTFEIPLLCATYKLQFPDFPTPRL